MRLPVLSGSWNFDNTFWGILPAWWNLKANVHLSDSKNIYVGPCGNPTLTPCEGTWWFDRSDSCGCSVELIASIDCAFAMIPYISDCQVPDATIVTIVEPLPVCQIPVSTLAGGAARQSRTEQPFGQEIYQKWLVYAQVLALALYMLALAIVCNKDKLRNRSNQRVIHFNFSTGLIKACPH